MSQDGLFITVTVNRKSLFPKAVTPKMILLDGMKFGCIRDGRFIPGEYGTSFVVAYHPERIGRGIQIGWDNKNVRYTELRLNLPSTNEELDDFFRMTARLARQDLSEVQLNGKPFIPKQFDTIKERYRVYNLKLLHEMMGNVLNESPGQISIGCVFHRLAAGEKEADQMWAGINTDHFRDWLHESQSSGAFYSEARIRERDQDLQAVFTMPSGRSVILPDHEELPLRFYDLKTGKPRYEINDWLVELVDHSKKQVLGMMPLQKFRKLIPADKVSYFDAADSLLAPFTVEELNELLEQADREHA